MPDIELIGLILLLAVAVIFGYFYLKRAQARDVDNATTVDRTMAAPASSATPVSTQPAATTTTTTETVRRDGVDDV